MYFAVQSITPPPEGYPKHDTTFVPYLFPAPEPGRPLANNPDTQIFTILTEPLPVLPLSLPHLAPYLQAALEESQRVGDSRSRLHKLVNTTVAAANASAHANVTPILGPIVNAISGNKSDMEPAGPPIGVAGASGQKRNFISKMFRPKSSAAKGKGLNNEMYDVGQYQLASLLIYALLIIAFSSHTISHGISIKLISYTTSLESCIMFMW